MFSRIAAQRRAYLLSALAGPLGILEIGAFDNPTFRPDVGDNVRFLDFFSSNELRELHGSNPNRKLERIVDVDYLAKESNFAATIAERFDLVVANHVIEHIPDLILWFRQVKKLLSTPGNLFLAIPDRRYTFDYFRPETLATQLIRAHRDELKKPDFWQVVENIYYHQKVDVLKLWEGVQPTYFRPRFSLERALDIAEEKCREYADVHCWVFTPQSFEQCISDLRSGRLVEFAIKDIIVPQKDSNEFWVLLRTES